MSRTLDRSRSKLGFAGWGSGGDVQPYHGRHPTELLGLMIKLQWQNNLHDPDGYQYTSWYLLPLLDAEGRL